MNTQKVSVIIPCYNAGIYIQEALDSVFQQTYKNWEVLIVDDGSSDKLTHEILATIHHPQVQIYYQENLGVSTARNFAIEKATGEIILPLDADDRIASQYMEKALPFFDADANTGIVYCQAEKFGKESGPWCLEPFIEENMTLGNYIFCTAFFKKTDWILAGGYPLYTKHGLEDYAFWLRLLRLGRTVHRIDKVLFYYRINEVSRTTLFSERKENIIKTRALIFEDNIDFFAKHSDFFWEQITELTALKHRGLKYYFMRKVKQIWQRILP